MNHGAHIACWKNVYIATPTYHNTCPWSKKSRIYHCIYTKYIVIVERYVALHALPAFQLFTYNIIVLCFLTIIQENCHMPVYLMVGKPHSPIALRMAINARCGWVDSSASHVPEHWGGFPSAPSLSVGTGPRGGLSPWKWAPLRDHQTWAWKNPGGLYHPCSGRCRGSLWMLDALV